MALLDAGLPVAAQRAVLAAFGSPENVLASDDVPLRRDGGLNEDQLRRLRESAADNARRAKQLESFERTGQRLVLATHADYPARLRDLEEPPPALFVVGTLRPADDLAVALVGPRTATPYGLEVARRLATQFAPVLTVVSGLALGIDSAAHDHALRAGGRTIGVAACGLDEDYPQGNGPLRTRIPEAGAIVGMWPPLTKARTHHFPARNTLIAALSLAVVVVEAGETSGSLLTAKAAAELGRDVFAVPGDIVRANSKGSNRLLAEGAGVCTCAEDVIAALEGPIRAAGRAMASAPKDAPEPENLSPAERAVLDAVRHAQARHDDLAARFVPATMAVGDLAVALLNLELKGLVRQLPGGVYIAG